jgi:hypothetical protein
MILDFNVWEIAENFSPASGASDKDWIINKQDKTIGLFKFPKSDQTFEHFSEKIASELAKIIGVESANVDIGIYDNKIGSMSYLINDKTKEVLIEGIALISKYRKNYDMKKMQDLESNEYYCFEMILEAIKGYKLEDDFFKVVIFDYIIGNSDRHHSNWAILESNNNIRFCPIYDNGSSLCCYITDFDIETRNNNPQWFDSIIGSKSRSIIRIDKSNKKKPTHKEVMEYIKESYYEETINFVRNIKDKLTSVEIDNLIDKYSYNILSENRKEFLKRYLNQKVKQLISIYCI